MPVLMLAGSGIAVAMAFLMVVVLDQDGGPPTRHVALPPVAAGPRQVVQVYLEALEAKDFDTADELIAQSAGDDFQTWFSESLDISNVEVGRSVGNSTVGEVYVEAFFDVEGADVSLPDGRTTWGFMLERLSGSPRWLIYDQGTG